MLDRILLWAVLAVGLGAPLQGQAVVAGSGHDKAKPAPTRPAARPTSPEDADVLANAALRGDVETVRAQLAKGVDPDARGGLGKSALRAATSFGCMTAPEKDVLAIVDLLIETGAVVNEVDDYGLGVLLMASQKCKAPVIARLLKAGADVEQRSPQGFSPLAMALIVKNFDAARALVEHGARLSRESMAKIFPEAPADPEQAALVKRATGAR
ncbi:MAG TPA: ankyrin repeat domain-containing protein [Vicinamibacteria bacterium]|nr:ankyrin repeat domain-containing protein [Vicinamibacteria bacterium]